MIWKRAKEPAIHTEVSVDMQRKGYTDSSRRQERFCIVRVKPGWGLRICELVVASLLLCVAS